MDEQIVKQQDKSWTFSPREFLLKHLRYIPWLILSVSLLITLSYVKLRYSTSIYEVRSKLLVKNDGSGSKDKFQDLFMVGGALNLNDEIEILKSSGLSKRIVRNLGLQTSYYNLGNLKSYFLHPDDAPFKLEILQLKDSMRAVAFEVKYINETTINLNNDTRPVYFGQIIDNAAGRFRFLNRPVKLSQYGESKLFSVLWRPIGDVASEIANGFNIVPINDYSNVLLIRYETENPKIGKDIINQLMQEYNNSSVEDKRTITVYTMEFIDERLDTLKRELGGVEQNLQNFREQNRALDLEQQSVISFNDLNEANKLLNSQEVQLKVIGYLQNYMNDEKNTRKTVPTSLGITEPSLQALIQQYNSSQLRRETQAKSTTELNPLIVELDTDIQKLREQILENLSNIRESYMINRNDLILKNQEAEKDLSAMPGTGRRMLEITRQQKILEDLYSFLLQKKLETSISSASTISNSKVVEPAYFSMTPIRPDKKSMYILAFVLGLGIPVGIIALKEYLNDKINSRYDIEKFTQAPILGEIGHSDELETLVVNKNNRKFISEQFRIIRTNLKYTLNKIEKPVILVTSSFSGEGKSFVSTNIGAVLALTGKKTVIVEFDIRKPKIIAGLDLARKSGITNYIVGKTSIEDMIIPVTQVENLYVIPCGPIPPNPSELLLDDKVGELFKYLREHFDAVIIDSAPLGLVSDAVVLSAYADATIYIMRQNYTLKKLLALVNDLYTNNKLPRLSILLNDVEGNQGYGYYGSYGYGYSYGNSGDYFVKEKRKQKGILKTIRSVFGRK